MENQIPSLQQIIDILHLDFKLVLLILVGGYIAKIYLARFTVIRIKLFSRVLFTTKIDLPWKVLFMAVVLSACYVAVGRMDDQSVPIDYQSLFFSFIITVGLYPYIKRPFIFLMNKIFSAFGMLPSDFDQPGFNEFEEPPAQQVDKNNL
jgi:hypothetical protein